MPPSTQPSATHLYSAAGTYAVKLTATGPGGSTTKTALITVRGGPRLADFNADGKSDIVLRQTSTGVTSMWMMNGGAVQFHAGNWAVAGDFVIQGFGDFDGDRNADILWRQTSTGKVSIWLFSGGAVKSFVDNVGGIDVPSDWVIQGVGDFDSDGTADILWRQTSTGKVSLWLISGGAVKSSVENVGGSDLPSDWVIQGVGDLDGDKDADILWRQTSTGKVSFWLLKQGAVESFVENVGGVDRSSDWVIQGVGDLNGDKNAYILWRQTSTGKVSLWLVKRGVVESFVEKVGQVDVPSDWVIRGVGDLDGDKKPDILWRQTSTGKMFLWLMNGGAVKSFVENVEGIDLPTDWVMQP